MDDREAAAAKIQVILNLTWFLYIVVDFWLFSIVWLENVFFVLFLWTFSFRNFLIVKKRVLQGDFYCCLWSFLLIYTSHKNYIIYSQRDTVNESLIIKPYVTFCCWCRQASKATKRGKSWNQREMLRRILKHPQPPPRRTMKVIKAPKLSQKCETVSLQSLRGGVLTSQSLWQWTSRNLSW